MTVEITKEQAIKIVQDKTSRYQLGKLSDDQLTKLVQYLDNSHEYQLVPNPSWEEYYKNQYIK
jgi:hypothetical protein